MRSLNRFRFHADAMQALEKMNNFPLAGRPVRGPCTCASFELTNRMSCAQIKVGLVTEKMTMMAQREGGILDDSSSASISGMSCMRSSDPVQVPSAAVLVVSAAFPASS